VYSVCNSISAQHYCQDNLFLRPTTENDVMCMILNFTERYCPLNSLVCFAAIEVVNEMLVSYSKHCSVYITHWALHNLRSLACNNKKIYITVLTIPPG